MKLLSNELVKILIPFSKTLKLKNILQIRLTMKPGQN